MNTNINNKKFKLVPLRNQPMQAFACKRECDKEASGDDEEEREGKEKGEESEGSTEGKRGLRLGWEKKKL